MPRIRKLRLRDYVVIATVVLLQTADLILTYVHFERELNPLALWQGKELFSVGKAAATLTLSLLYVLHVWTPRDKLLFEIIVIGFSLSPFLFILYQIIVRIIV